MKCINCGNEFNTYDNKCPTCGYQMDNSSVSNNQSIPVNNQNAFNEMLNSNLIQNNEMDSKKELDNTNNSNSTISIGQRIEDKKEQISGVENISNNNQNNNFNNKQNLVKFTQNNNLKRSRSNAVIYLIIAFFAVILIVGVLSSLFGKDSVFSSDMISIGKYRFEIPDGYEAREDSEYGIIFTNDEYAFTIDIDSNHSYSDYFKKIEVKYPKEAPYSEITVNDRIFAGIVYESSISTTTCQYYTELDSNSAYKGIIQQKPSNSDSSQESNKLDSEIFSTIAKTLGSAKTSIFGSDRSSGSAKLYTEDETKYDLFGE